MASSLSIRGSTVRLLVAGVVVISAACGTTDRSDESDPTFATESTAAAVPSSTVPSLTVPSSTVPSSAVSSSVLPSDGTSAGPACEDGLLPSLAAHDRTTGELEWTYCSADRAWREVLGATDDVVYLGSTMPDPSASGSEFGQVIAVIAVDVASGAELWRVPVAHPQLGWPPGPFAGGGVVVVGVQDGDGAAIVGLDAGTADELWRIAESDLGGAAASPTPPWSVVAPLANTDQVVVLAVPSGLVGLDRATGQRLWSSDVFLLDESGVGASRGPAAVDGSTVMIPAASQVRTVYPPPQGAVGGVEGGGGCCVAPDGAVYCSGPVEPGGDDPPCQPVTAPIGPSTLVAVDAMTGATLWRGPRLDHPTAAEGYVVGYDNSSMGSSSPPDSEVIVVDATTGAQLWNQPGSESYGDLWAIGDGAVYVNVADDVQRNVVAYELESGDERWRRATDMSLPTDPQQVADDKVVLLWGDLAVLSTSDGTTQWTVSAPADPETPMSSVGHNATSIFVSFNGRPSGD
jgi:outer membrane protein assembly factor BamB